MPARLAIVAAALLFSTGGAAIKMSAMTAFQVASLRSLVAALVLALIFPGGRRNWSYKTLMVGVAYAATMILFVLGNKLTTAANTIFLQSTAPLYVLALSPKLLGERARRSDLLLMAIMALGLGLFFIEQPAATQSAPNPSLGNILSAITGVSYALTLMGIRWLERGDAQRRDEERRGVGREQSAQQASEAAGASETAQSGGGRGMQAVIAGNLLAGLMAAPWMFPLETGAQDVAIIAYLGVIQIGLAYVFLTYGFRHVRAFEASLIILLEPLFSPLWAWWFHGERPGVTGVIGGVMILLATALKGWSDSRRAQWPQVSE